MDLGTIKKKISSRKYKTIRQAADDVRLVWSNCMTYNADGSDFYLLAQSLNKKWEEKYSKFAADHQIDDGAGSEAKVSLDQMKSFARSLYKLPKDDLGKIIVEIDTKCPAALVKNAGEDECELNVDKITPSLFRELVQFVDSCIGGSKAPPAKKAKRAKT